MPEWNTVKQGNACVTDGEMTFWADFPTGTSAAEVLDAYLDTADYSGATERFTVVAEIDGQTWSRSVAASIEAVNDALQIGGYGTWPRKNHILMLAESASDERTIRRIDQLLKPLGWHCSAAGNVLRCDPSFS